MQVSKHPAIHIMRKYYIIVKNISLSTAKCAFGAEAVERNQFVE